ncbi:orotate phosphoribosyltransferase [uncultured Abyssibacter sp.]|uniref:orotate phosphoribosyltransferase n=1 Tax=uncultured Abyssibacter sp. TaxID=2320202 RepID=UPI0032B17B25
MTPAAKTLIHTALDRGALKLGSFTLKSGRPSPYFFNFGALDNGEALLQAAEAYADLLMDAEFDVLFGPAYKGIPLAAAIAVVMARRGRSVAYAYNRKEAKDHGEGGNLVGAPVTGRVALVDDVVTAGTAIRQAIGLVREAGGTPVLAVVALDRQEAGPDGRSPLASLADHEQIEVRSLFTAADVAETIDATQPDAAAAIRRHLGEYGAGVARAS